MPRDTVLNISLDEIDVGERRSVDNSAVQKLIASIKSIGLQHPVTVRPVKDRFVLIAGRHRLEAFRCMREEYIPASIAKMSDIDAELWEISENLHRAELTVLERDEQVARWIKLTDQKKLSVQSAPKPQGGRPESGISAASRELGIDTTDAKRAAQVASLSDDAKEAARNVGLDDNRTALLTAAREAPEHQAAKISELAAAKANRFKVAADPLHDIEASEKQVARLMDAWNAAGPDARQEFLARIDQPVMDRKFA